MSYKSHSVKKEARRNMELSIKTLKINNERTIEGREQGITLDQCGDLYLSEDYESYLVEVEEIFYDEIKKINYACAFPVNPFFAVLSVQKGQLERLRSEVTGMGIVERSQPYTLSQIQPAQVAHINLFHSNSLLALTGKGVIIGFLDTGIDYLNEEFMTLDKKTRILEIWDQTNQQGTPPQGFSFGSVYTRDQIDAAIEAKRNGGDPYAIVPQRDTIGHGTADTGIAAATGVTIPKGAAPDCDIIMVKLKEAKRNTIESAGIVDPMVPVYESTDMSLAIRYLNEVIVKYNQPMAVIIPLNTNYGGASGSTFLERFIDYYSIRREVVYVAGSGNQGDSGTHTSGIIRRTGDIANIEVRISKEENIVVISIYGKSPDKFTISIVSPSGESIQKPPTKLQGEDQFQLILEGSIIRVSYSLQDARTGDEVIIVAIINSREGVWRIRLTGEYIVDGRYDAWLPQRELLKGDTRFLNSDPYTTVQSPGTAFNIITTAFYNQQNNSIEPASGRGFTRDGRVKPEIATGGVDVITTFLDNETITVTGSSAASSVLVGACALILEWGVVRGNDPSLYGPTVSSYFIRGANQRSGDIYPNREWGYGTLDMLGSLEIIRGLERSSSLSIDKDTICKKLTTKIPKELYKRLILLGKHSTKLWGRESHEES